jgi:hypothetical protein
MVTRTVLLYGRSLLLPLVAACLEENPGLRVMHATTWRKASKLVAEAVPDVLIFDMSDAHQSDILLLLAKNPHLLLVGLDVERNQAVLLGGQEARSLDLRGVRQIVERGRL